MKIYSNSHLSYLQQELKKKGLKAYLITSGDPHNCEEPAPCFAYERLYFCPFEGTNATVVITQDEAYLYVDGRFFISAEKDIEGTPFILMKMGQKDFPSVEELLKDKNLYPLGTDLSILPYSTYLDLAKAGEVRDISFATDLPGKPLFPSSPLWDFDGPSYHDLTPKEKIEKVREKMSEKGAKAHLVTTLDDIAYLTHLRGNDIECTPLFLSYLYLGEDKKNYLFVKEGRLNKELRDFLILPYESIDAFLKERKQIPTLVDLSECNARLASILENPINEEPPSRLMKAIKGEKEIENIISIQEEDGAALVKFMRFVEENKDRLLTEWDYAVALGEFRKQGKRYIEDSFLTIAAVGPNAAMMHYAPSEKIFDVVDPNKHIELLVDSGGQYFGGTTDTTRTILIGKPSGEYVNDYTSTLRSVIALTTSIFLDGSTGRTLDYPAREIMWKQGLDYKCGTGHGVGYLSVVHESPNGFRYRSAANKKDDAKIVPGMVTTVEPGVYKANKYGIRIENNILCVPAFETSDGSFYRFQTITYAPIDVRALDLDALSKEDKQWLNSYHEEVLRRLTPYLEGKDLEFLKEATKAI